jgi:hypothetical protein
MHNFTDLVDENHDILLQDLRCVCKVTNITKPEDTHDLATWKNRVYATARFNVLRNNLRTGFSISNGQECTNLNYGPLKYLSFEYFILSSRE